MNESVIECVQDVLISSLDAPVEVFYVAPSDYGVYGKFVNDSSIFDYALLPDCVYIQENPRDTEYLNDYVAGLIGYKGDSDGLYEWANGFLRLDNVPKCTLGGVRCGHICLPKGRKCRKTAGGNKQALKVRQAKSALKAKSPGVAVAKLAGTAALIAAGGAAAIGANVARTSAVKNAAVKNAAIEVKNAAISDISNTYGLDRDKAKSYYEEHEPLYKEADKVYNEKLKQGSKEEAEKYLESQMVKGYEIHNKYKKYMKK